MSRFPWGVFTTEELSSWDTFDPSDYLDMLRCYLEPDEWDKVWDTTRAAWMWLRWGIRNKEIVLSEGPQQMDPGTEGPTLEHADWQRKFEVACKAYLYPKWWVEEMWSRPTLYDLLSRNNSQAPPDTEDTPA